MPPRTRSRQAAQDTDTITDDTAVREDEQAADADAGRNPDISTASPVGRHPRDTQFPSLGDDGDEKVEIAERTIDIDTASGDGTVSSANHIKDFVLQADEWDSLDDDGKDAVHRRNQRAVRQSMLSQGLRAPLEEDVKFSGEKRLKGGRGGRSAGAESVSLRYTIAPTPVSVVASPVVDPETGQVDEKAYELVHMVVSPAPGISSAAEQDEWEQGAEARVRDSHAVKAGRAPAPSA